MKLYNRIKRLFRHLVYPSWRVAAFFPQRSLSRLHESIALSEHSHLGQIRFVVESGWNAAAIWGDKQPRDRALEWFGLTRAWDTEHNTGILIYVSFADHAIEIIADRSVAKKVDNAVWAQICHEMRPFFADKSYIVGLEVGLDEVTKTMQQYFPRYGETFANELPDEVIVR